MPSILVINSGSSSLKYQLIDMESEETLASGLIERIGEPSGGRTTHKTGGQKFERDVEVPDHAAACAVMRDDFDEHGPRLGDHELIAVGHRVVHGGSRFFEPTLIDDLVKINIEDLSELAPLHNPGAVQGISAAQQAFAGLPQVAVFDTAFHQTMQPEAYTYAIDQELATKWRIRRYGFHGTSHRYVSRAAADFVGRPVEELKQIVLHLGNGASACAIDGGRSIDTSMGLTPLAGLVMGTRSGDVDPSVLLHLGRRAHMSWQEIDDLLNKRSGLLGLSGHSDSRDVHDLAEAGDERAALAAHVFRRRVKHYVGAYAALLGGLDVISFTAGIGENNIEVRSESLSGLEFMGIEVDDDRNHAPSREAREISSDSSRVKVLVVPTNEELEIARQTLEVISH
ncbi:acetate/propionate family kinase [Gryllotalpicola protaetiae]|uniref:Acetate kinase n=1 Tax=Gryllotalpicola protaetiae TaxID=2419771 RepID=A0A387BSW0_9MICO|nr:acetate kinase [Gryllotalpicola protaetiae]AYG04150.1 acetate kinase [Gryllotalpicola protaetiae]